MSASLAGLPGGNALCQVDLQDAVAGVARVETGNRLAHQVLVLLFSSLERDCELPQQPIAFIHLRWGRWASCTQVVFWVNHCHLLRSTHHKPGPLARLHGKSDLSVAKPHRLAHTQIKVHGVRLHRGSVGARPQSGQPYRGGCAIHPPQSVLAPAHHGACQAGTRHLVPRGCAFLAGAHSGPAAWAGCAAPGFSR